jgi:cysteine-rich repeat protein
VCTEVCGDGKNFKKLSTVTKECDDGDTTGGDGCAADCDVEVGWTCTGGSRTAPDVCTEICGDGYNYDSTSTGAVGEACDDTNKLNNDGCSSACRVEEGWYCDAGSASDTNAASVCLEKAMDGLDFGTFACDQAANSLGCIGGVI